MKLTTRLLLSLCVFAIVACNGGEPDIGDYPAKLRTDSNLDGAAPCDVDTQCPDGATCIVLSLDSGPMGPLCLDPEEACAAVSCGPGECLFAESYPLQLFCHGPTDGNDGDDEDVSSD